MVRSYFNINLLEVFSAYGVVNYFNTTLPFHILCDFYLSECHYPSLCPFPPSSERMQNIHVVHHIHSVQLTMSNTMVSATLVSHLSIHVYHLMVLARTILRAKIAGWARCSWDYGISCLDLKSKTFFWIRSNEPICIQSQGSRQHWATLEGNSLWIGGGRHINRLTPITCLPLATTVHKLDEPRSLIEDVRPTPAAAKHVFSLSIFGS